MPYAKECHLTDSREGGRVQIAEGSGTAPVLAILIGAVAFLIVVGPAALGPSNIAWLQHGDPTFHYLGWKFFAQSPWTMPPGANPLYGLEFSNSVFYSDSIPLLALFFKVFGAAREGEFQYFGLWLLACFCLQCLAGYLLAGLVAARTFPRAVMAAFFVFAPIMLWRLTGHYALVGHFLILFALYLNLRGENGPSLAAWPALIVAASLIHAYLLAMVLPMWGSDIVRRCRRPGMTKRGFVTEAAAVLIPMIAGLWAAGFFVIAGGYGEGGFGFYRADILALVNPAGWMTWPSWSHFLPALPIDPGEYEGFNYVGAGIMLAIVLVAAARIAGRHDPVGSLGVPIPLLAVLAAFTLVALSSTISLGAWQITLSLPEKILNLFSVVRASGRFLWPVVYLLFFLVFLVAVRTYGEMRAAAVLSVCLVLQIADTSAAWIKIRESHMVQPASHWGQPASEAFWTAASRHYRNLRVVPQGRVLEDWSSLSLVASNHGMATTAAAFARVDPSKWSAEEHRLITSIRTGSYDKDSLYILDKAWALWAFMTLDRSRDLLTQVDGHLALLPDYDECADCPQLQPLSLFDLGAVPPLGTELEFTAGGAASAFLLSGWSSPESWGTWSEGRVAQLLIPLPADQHSNSLSLSLKAQALLGEPRPSQSVKVSVNGIPAGDLVFDAGHNLDWRRLDVPPQALSPDGGGALNVTLEIAEPIRPMDMGLGQDGREIGIGLVALRLSDVP